MAGRPIERRRLDQMTDDDLDWLYADHARLSADLAKSEWALAQGREGTARLRIELEHWQQVIVPDLRASLERARAVAVALENENARLEDYAAIDKKATEKADRECDEHIAAGREFRKWGEECQRVGARFWLAWKSARRRALAESLRADGHRDLHQEQRLRAEAAERLLAQVRAVAVEMRDWHTTPHPAHRYGQRLLAELDGGEQPEEPFPAALRAAGMDPEDIAIYAAQPVPGVTVHACPPYAGDGLTPCCRRPPFEMRGDRLTRDPDAVTCTGPNEGSGPA